MKSENPEKFLKVRKLVKKLGDLAEVLDEISKKMRLAAEKQKIHLEHIDVPSRNGRRILTSLQKKLESIDSIPIHSIQISKAQELSQDLIDVNPDARKPLGRMSYHEYVEFTCLDEFKKFRNMPAISPEEIQLCDWDELFERFQR